MAPPKVYRLAGYQYRVQGTNKGYHLRVPTKGTKRGTKRGTSKEYHQKFGYHDGVPQKGTPNGYRQRVHDEKLPQYLQHHQDNADGNDLT